MNAQNSATASEQLPQKKSNTIWIIVLVLLALMLCACLAVIVLLGLFGPVVGNVFSNIILTAEPLP